MATAPRTPTPHPAADSLHEITDKLFYAGKYDSLYQVAASFARRGEASKDSVLLGRALVQRGRVLLMLGRFPKAEPDIDAAIHIGESIRDTTSVMAALTFKGFILYGAGKQDEALQCFDRRLALAQRVHSPVDEAWARTSLGYYFHDHGDQDRAKKEYHHALDLFHGAGQRRMEINALIGLGRVESALGNGPASIRWYEQALVASRATADPMNEMWSANNLAVMETMQGDLSRSWQYLQHAIALARQLKSPYGMVVPAANLSKAFEELGDFDSAQAVLDETRTLCETSGAAYQLPYLDYQLSGLRMRQGRYANAALLLRGLMKHPESLEVQHRDMVAANLALALSWSDSTHAAIDLLSNYINTPGRHMYGDTAPSANLILGQLYERAGDTGDALVYARRAQVASLPAAQKRPMVFAMLLESRCARASGDREHAASVFHAALDSLDAVRGGIGTAEWREVYGQSVSEDVVEAGRVLLEYPQTASRAKRERSFFDAVQRVKSRALLDRINRPHAENEPVEEPSSNHVATLADLQHGLQAGEALLDFCVGSNRTYLAAVTTDSLRIVELPGPNSPLAGRVQLLRTVLSSTDASLRAQYGADRLADVQRSLGADILKNVSDLIGNATRVFVCPDGFFASVPFGMLIDDDKNEILMAKRDIVQIPSSTVLVLERSRASKLPGQQNLVAISATGAGLTGARGEVRDLARHYRNVEQLVDLKNVDAFASASRHAGVLHIASHALVVDRSPWWSGIQLHLTSGDTGSGTRSAGKTGFLSAVDSLSIEKAFPSDPYVRAWQIGKLDIPAQLAVLSACETAGGRMTTGEGTLGLTAAFLSAGVPVVVSSLWPVDDRATAIIMRSFYHHLSGGESVATALRAAQLETSRSSKYSHPFYWAGFTVVGDGSMVVPIQKRLVTWSHVLEGVGILLLLAAVVLSVRSRRPRPGVG